MHFIGITGGVGSGKSMVLRYIESTYGAHIIYSDALAAALCSAGGECISKIKSYIPQIFPESVIDTDGGISRDEMSRIVFGSREARECLNDIVHPAVKEEILKVSERLRDEGGTKLLILEAALLIEEGYDKVCDELWYVHASSDVRRMRLKESRGYSDEKVSAIMASQLSEEVFLTRCDVIIENNGTKEECYPYIDREIERLFREV